jgi:hypothetical protein
MKTLLLPLVLFFSGVLTAAAAVEIDVNAFGKNLGGWVKRDGKSAEYPLSGSVYRTYKPEVSATPDGGIFISVRIDHVRGWLSSDDHAILEITVDAKGGIASAQSNIAIQGRSISTDVILGGTESGNKLYGTDRAVQIGTDLVANLSAKLLREKLVEAGRVSFPAALRHNYNMIYQSLRVNDKATPPLPGATPTPAPEAPKPVPNPTPEPPKPPTAESAPLKITPYGTPVEGGRPINP